MEQSNNNEATGNVYKFALTEKDTENDVELIVNEDELYKFLPDGRTLAEAFLYLQLLSIRFPAFVEYLEEIHLPRIEPFVNKCNNCQYESIIIHNFIYVGDITFMKEANKRMTNALNGFFMGENENLVVEKHGDTGATKITGDEKQRLVGERMMKFQKLFDRLCEVSNIVRNEAKEAFCIFMNTYENMNKNKQKKKTRRGGKKHKKTTEKQRTNEVD